MLLLLALDLLREDKVERRVHAALHAVLRLELARGEELRFVLAVLDVPGLQPLQRFSGLRPGRREVADGILAVVSPGGCLAEDPLLRLRRHHPSRVLRCDELVHGELRLSHPRLLESLEQLLALVVRVVEEPLHVWVGVQQHVDVLAFQTAQLHVAAQRPQVLAPSHVSQHAPFAEIRSSLQDAHHVLPRAVQHLHLTAGDDEHVPADLSHLEDHLFVHERHQLHSHAELGDEYVVVEAPVAVDVEERHLVDDVTVLVHQQLAPEVIRHLHQDRLRVVRLRLLLAEVLEHVFKKLPREVVVADKRGHLVHLLRVSLLARVGVGHHVRHRRDHAGEDEAADDHAEARDDALDAGGGADVAVPHGGHRGKRPVYARDVPVPHFFSGRFVVAEVALEPGFQSAVLDLLILLLGAPLGYREVVEEAAEEVAEVEHEYHQLRDADEVHVLEQVVLVPLEQPHDLEQSQQLDQAEQAEEFEELEELPGAVVIRIRRAPVNLHGAPQRTLRRPQRQIHGQARQQIDREPRLEVILADELRMVDDDALFLLRLVAGAKVEEDVEPKVEVDGELDPVGWTLRGLL